MNFCRNCGAGLGMGRFCTNCGTPVAPVDHPSSPNAPTRQPSGEPGNPAESSASGPAVEAPAEKTAVRMPAVPPVERPVEETAVRMPAVPPPPPPSTEATGRARYPLFADELPTRAPDGAPRGSAGSAGALVARPESGGAHAAGDDHGTGNHAAAASGTHRERRSGRVGWIVAAVLLLLMCGGGIAWWVSSGDDSDDAAGSSQSPSPDETGATNDPSEDPTEDIETPEPPDDPPVDLAESATASGPAPVAPGQDFSGQTFRYPASNMLDGDPSTAYRMNGDRSGTTITFELGEEATMREVGIVNGFAKTDTDPSGADVDWYAGNRRILAVEWIFDDGTVVSQDLRETTKLQTIAVDGVTTSSVKLRLTEVSPPGPGKWGRDVTSIGTVLLRGSVD